MRLLITGGAGCLGSNLIEHFLPKGHVICVIDNLATGKRQVIPNHPNLVFIEGSISDQQLVQTTFKNFKPTHVIHSAAAYKDPTNWIEDVNTNVMGTIHVINAAQVLGVEKFINFQTALCYGRPSDVPIPIEHPTNPFTSYGISKTAGEAYLMQSDLSYVSLRLANICGPRLAIGPIPTFYKRLKAGQSCFYSDAVRDFIDMQDFLDLIKTVLENHQTSGTFNVSSGEGHSIKDVFDLVAKYLKIPDANAPEVPVGSDDVREVVLDPSQTEIALGWKTKVNFEQTIINQLDWYEKYGVNDIYSHLNQPKA